MCHPRTAPSRSLCLDLLAWMRFILCYHFLSFLYSSDMPQKWLKVTQCAVSGVLSHVIERSPWVTGLVCISWIKRADGPWRGCMRTERYMIMLASALVSRGLWEGVRRFSHSVYVTECSTLQLVLASSPSTPVLNWPALHSEPPRDDERGEIKRAVEGGEKDYAVYRAWTQQR